MDIEKIYEGYHGELIKLTCDLVNIPTENRPPYGDEKAGQEFFEKYIREMGLETDMFSPEDIPEYKTNPEFLPRELKDRKDVVGVWKGSGGGKSVILSGHMDVAPKEPMAWTVCEPFNDVVKDGKIYGRGSSDMKGGIACAAIAVKMLKESGFQPKGDIILETVVDEEYAGANGTIASRLKGYNGDFAIDLEPSGLNVCPACVGGLLFKLTIKGIAGMPYTGEEIINPVYDLAQLIGIIGEFEKKRQAEAKKPELWDNSVQDPQIVVTKVKAGEVEEDGQLSTPIDAWMEISLQSYPGEKQEDLEKELKDFVYARFRDPDILTIETEYHYCRPTSMDKNHEGVQMLANCAKDFTDKAVVCGALFSCDLFVFHEIGKTPGVVFGPVGGRLHAPDEWVDIDSMAACTKSLAAFIEKWCG